MPLDPGLIRRRSQRFRLATLRNFDLQDYELNIIRGCQSRLKKGQDLTEKQAIAVNAIMSRLRLKPLVHIKADRMVLAAQIETAIDVGVFPLNIVPVMEDAVSRLRDGVDMTNQQAGYWGGYRAVATAKTQKVFWNEPKPKPKPKSDVSQASLDTLIAEIQDGIKSGALSKVKKVMTEAVSRLRTGQDMTQRQRGLLARYRSLKKRGLRQ